MPLTAGDKLGPYKILAQIGAGGMGEVYRARDPRLDRWVAIKLIRAELAQRGDLRHRFQREARAISALNHPHICGLYDIGDQDGTVYLVMEYVAGETLAAALKKGLLPLVITLRYAAEIADALAAAHSHGIIHRDLKPANIMITGSGVKVLDFGLAKRSEPAKPVEDGSTFTIKEETSAGQIVGTVAYMSPEQAEGMPVDARSDIFSLGVVLYEMLCGRRPFRGETTLSTLAAILREDPEPPRELRREIPEHVERVVLRCLEKKPEARYGSAEELHKELAEYQSISTGGKALQRRAVVAATLLATIAVGALGFGSYIRSSRARWAENEALPEIVRLLEKNRLISALRLYRQAEQYSPSSRGLVALTENLYVSPVSIETTPAGAEISVADYADTDPAHWESLGRSPLKTDRIPFRGYYRIRAVQKGFETVEQAFSPGGGSTVRLLLHTPEETPAGMVWVPGEAAGAFLSPAPAVALSAFWLDKYEVTNRQFKEFVDAGGYQKREYWKEPFVKNGQSVSWDEAMTMLRDATGRPGPATWQLGTLPEGRADFPVGGVSWYEAAAYAVFARKSLPTVYHWYRGAGVGFFSDILNLSNFTGKGPASVGTNHGLAPFGEYDMAGNVKEWAVNPAGDHRYILGGGWDEPSYQFEYPDARLPFDREATFGFRCAIYSSPPLEALTGPVAFGSNDRRGDKPADDQTFRILKDLHSYDKKPLKPEVQSVDNSSQYVRREDVTFQAAYGNERVVAHLYLPKNAEPPYQVVAFFGSGGMLSWRTLQELHDPFEFIVRSGRALILPAYKGTLERGPMPDQAREAMLEWSKDLGRSIDYLETRPDIDTTKLAYYGISFGAAMSPRLIAVEPRFKAALLVSGGSMGQMPPEVDPWNFTPRVTIPVLMLNGRDDFTFPLETSQLPLFRSFATPEKDKKHVLYEGGHVNLMTRLDLVKEALAWLDRYLGPVRTRP